MQSKHITKISTKHKEGSNGIGDKSYKTCKTNNQMTVINPSLSVIKCIWIKLLQWKRQRLTEWTKNIIQLYAVWRDLFMSKDTNSLKVKEWKKYIPASINKNRVAKWKWDKIDFKLKTVVKDKRHYILIKRSIHQEYVIVISMYINNKSPKICEGNIDRK